MYGSPHSCVVNSRTEPNARRRHIQQSRVPRRDTLYCAPSDTVQRRRVGVARQTGAACAAARHDKCDEARTERLASRLRCHKFRGSAARLKARFRATESSGGPTERGTPHNKTKPVRIVYQRTLSPTVQRRCSREAFATFSKKRISSLTGGNASCRAGAKTALHG